MAKEPTVKGIGEAIEQFAPLAMQESYDNSGLQIGLPDAKVSGVLVCLTPGEYAVAEAKARGCNMIVSHHPLLFRPLKRITGSSPVERTVAAAIRHDVAIYSAHTNLDSAPGGVSRQIASRLGVEQCTPLLANSCMEGAGLGLVGNLPAPMPALEFVRLVAKTFSVKGLRYSAMSSTLVVRRVAMCGGAGASMIADAIAAGADAYLSGDLGYHDFDTYGSALLLLDVGHYETEADAADLLARIVRKAFPDLPVLISETEQNPVARL